MDEDKSWTRDNESIEESNRLAPPYKRQHRWQRNDAGTQVRRIASGGRPRGRGSGPGEEESWRTAELADFSGR